MTQLRRSITLRLTLAFGVIALTVFSGMSTLIYRSLADELSRIDREVLLGKAEVVKHFIEEAQSTGDLNSLAHHLDDALIGHDTLQVWLVSTSGSLVYGKTGLPKLDQLVKNQIHALHIQDDTPMLALRVTVPDSPSLDITEALIGMHIRPRERLLASQRNTLLLLCATGICLILVLGALATQHGLKPVQRLSRAADAVATTSLATRLPLTQVDVELIDLARAFNNALDRVERAYRQMEAFNANVAHELRTPLNTLINGAQVTLSGTRSNAQLRESLAAGLEDVERLKAMVNDMLFLARADQGDKAAALEQVELADEAAKAIEYFEPLLHEAGLSARCEGSARVQCNPSLVRRALVNLLSNAAKHTARGEALAVHIAPGTASVKLSVYNPGEPPTAQVMTHMFDRFYRADESRAQPGESNGLGLAIVRAVAQMHHGEVFAHRHAAGLSVGFSIAF